MEDWDDEDDEVLYESEEFKRTEFAELERDSCRADHLR
jgi:hypothetical protein